MGDIGTHTVNTTERLAKLRELMSSKKYDVKAYVVPSEDSHFSEYSAHCDERRAYISGFNGSAGCAVVTTDNAYLFTDGRYFLQAEKQLDRNWTLMKQGLPDVPTWQEFLHKNLEKNTRIGLDPTLLSVSDAQSLREALSPVHSELVPLEDNLVDLVWGADRPPRPTNPIFALDVKYAGESHSDKIKKVRAELEKQKAKAAVVNMLDEVEWLFNLRGSDIDFNPVFFAYAVITPTRALLFVDPTKLTPEVRAHLGHGVEVKPYVEFFPYLKGLSAELGLSKEMPVIVGDKASLAVADAIGHDNITIARSHVADLKSIKNATEIAGFRASHVRDGAALAKYFSWLQAELDAGTEWSEWKAAEVLEGFRKEGELFQGLSFTTISSTGPNGAIIHYSPDPEDCAIIRKDQIYLCDSGAQYLDGTTDVTRTWHFGTPTDEEKRAFTRVLQGHIAIDTAIFPSGTTGYVIDSWARRPLWEDGLDYRHGTGHGVGHFLNVHEGPHGIGVRIAYNNTPLKPGMTVSNEPGYYADGKFGIRIENVVIVKEAKTPNNFGDKGYLGFENVTMCPIQKKLIDTTLLSVKERAWLDKYHQEVLDKVGPLLKNDARALEWLERECSPL
ncbi:Creatinase/aminopeptidase [Punctularia strigosozonata HHB-11173 SS5]|uniref:Creatinase/aminopeptidase n=1 Tax=Punctularia strigosozonata (strain HHB-11173) TaxID=741275 RepID=UPI0004416705|nr:Creatinase/aminopeptidase [Punctularia strigosozonata HHB-11173 SS5]EIN09077.1 Creatinase/aminopeptidase [Punctularia strigosozonata HHB-11173 SS5]